MDTLSVTKEARILEWVAIPFYRDFPNPGIEPRSPALQADSLPAELPGKPKKMGTTGNSKSKYSIKIVFSNLLTFFLGYFSTYVQT